MMSVLQDRTRVTIQQKNCIWLHQDNTEMEIKAMAKVAKPKKEITMEEALWKSADKLRGSVEPAEYKHVVLSLFFLKFASDKFEDCRRRIIEKHGERFEKLRKRNIEQKRNAQFLAYRELCIFVNKYF